MLHLFDRDVLVRGEIDRADHCAVRFGQSPHESVYSVLADLWCPELGDRPALSVDVEGTHTISGGANSLSHG